MASSVLMTLSLFSIPTTAFVPFIDGGKGMPVLYKGFFNEQIAKQAATAVNKAVSAGKKKIEVNFPSVPNVDEVRFGTPLNKKFGTSVVARELGLKYTPGSNLSRNLIAYSNIYWAKKIGPALGSGIGSKVNAVTAEQVFLDEIKSKGNLNTLPMSKSSTLSSSNDALIAVNPGGEETWDRLYNACGAPDAPFCILNNAYSTTYGLGNKRGYEEAYYLKRISKGWVFRSFPGPWEAYLEKPDGTVELLKTYNTKPQLNEVAKLVREESFSRYAIGNDRWTPGFGERL